jgi:hypothetical protein
MLGAAPDVVAKIHHIGLLVAVDADSGKEHQAASHALRAHLGPKGSPEAQPPPLHAVMGDLVPGLTVHPDLERRLCALRQGHAPMGVIHADDVSRAPPPVGCPP